MSFARRFYLVAFLGMLLLLPCELRADDHPVTDPHEVAQQFHETKARPEFQDDGEAALNPQLEDLVSQWFKRLGAKMGEFKYASSMPAFESLLMTLLVALSLSVLLFIVMRLMRYRAWTGLEAEAVSTPATSLRHPEFYDAEIRQAVAARDWSAAWLAAWRQFLSRLERRNLVQPDRTRTNREYLSQIQAKPVPLSALQLATTLVDSYDRFVYGRITIGEQEWLQFHRRIEETALLLHLDDRTPPAPTRVSP